MKRSKRDKEITDTIPQLIPHAEPNTESLEAIHESDAFFAKGNPGRFDNAADLIDAALKDPKALDHSITEEAAVSEVSDWRGTYLAIFMRIPEV